MSDKPSSVAVATNDAANSAQVNPTSTPMELLFGSLAQSVAANATNDGEAEQANGTAAPGSPTNDGQGAAPSAGGIVDQPPQTPAKRTRARLARTITESLDDAPSAESSVSVSPSTTDVAGTRPAGTRGQRRQRTTTTTISAPLAVEETAALREQVTTLQASVGDLALALQAAQTSLADAHVLIKELQDAVVENSSTAASTRTTVKEHQLAIRDLGAADEDIRAAMSEQIAPVLTIFNKFMSSTRTALADLGAQVASADRPAKRSRIELDIPQVEQGSNPAHTAADAPAAPLAPVQLAPAFPSMPVVAAPAPSFQPAFQPGFSALPGVGSLAQQGVRPKKDFYVRLGPVNVNGARPLDAMRGLLGMLPNGALFAGLVKSAVLLGDMTHLVGTVWQQQHAVNLVHAWNTTKPATHAQVVAEEVAGTGF